MRHIDDAHHAEGDGEPIAANNKTEPSESPYQAFCSALQSARLPWIFVLADVAACRTAGGTSRRQAIDEAERVLIAAVADHGYRDILSSSLEFAE